MVESFLVSYFSFGDLTNAPGYPNDQIDPPIDSIQDLTIISSDQD